MTAAVVLTGCGAEGTFPVPSGITAEPAQVPVGSIKGSNYGGHAPLVGSHIYLLQTGNTGYGSVTTGLLNASYSGSYATTQNVNDQFVPATDSAGNPYFYETADANGAFNLTGDYSCTVGQPVYVVGYGGSPSSVGAGSDTFPISSITVSNVSGQDYGEGTATYTFSVGGTSPELFYAGESVTFSGTYVTANGDPGFFNENGPYVVSGTSLTTTGFQITFTGDWGGIPTASSPYFPAGTTLQSGATVTGTPQFNPAAVNMAMLGVCPSSGNFSTGASAIQYLYMNEISTTAMAYAMNQYLPWGTNDQSGNDEFHIGAPNTTQAQQGIQNAAINAGNLYDIQYAAVSSAGDGEGHIARSVTASGAGTVPQSTLNTIGNALAACVDSNNTYLGGNGTISPQCLTLDEYAQDNGVYDTTAPTHLAFNIAQAAFNIAHYPQGAGTGTTACGCYGGAQTVTAGTATTASNFTTALTNLPAGNVPFAPNLSAPPNDFAVAIQWNIGTAANDVQIDQNGNAFAVAGGSGMYEITPSGVISTYTGSLSTSNNKGLGSVAIDGVNGNIWATGATGVYEFTPGIATGTLVGSSNGTLGTGITLDSQVNQYWGSGGGSSTGTSIVKQNTAGVSAGGKYPILSGTKANSAGICAQAAGFMALDKSGNLWTATADDGFNGNPYVCRFDTLGRLKYSLAVPTGISGQAGGFGYPHGMATDSSDNAFFPDKNSDRIYKVAQGTTANNSGYTYLELHGQLSAPHGIAVDGANTLWISNPGDLPATTGAKYATGLVQFSNTPTLLTPNYITGAAYSAQPTTSLGSVAIDPSGNVWSVQSQIYGGAAPTLVYEYIGLAAPTVTPIATAKANGTVGVRP